MQKDKFLFNEWFLSFRIPYLYSSIKEGFQKWMSTPPETGDARQKGVNKKDPLYLLPISQSQEKPPLNRLSSPEIKSCTSSKIKNCSSSSITTSAPVLSPRVKALEPIVRKILVELGQDLTSEDFEKTPLRHAKALEELTQPTEFKFTVFENKIGYREMVLVREIPYYSFCPHHMLQIGGTATVAYIPKKQYAGLSKVPRTVTYCSRGYKTQEQITLEIGAFIQKKIKPAGVAVFLTGVHSCMACRGTKMPDVATETYSYLGVFDKDNSKRLEFLSRINNCKQ